MSRMKHFPLDDQEVEALKNLVLGLSDFASKQLLLGLIVAISY